ncbi:MAG: hypothetical protein CMN01_02060 [Rickettsiales bacterium]|mgnify:CR=1 FL=1|nr:hypothetical protein [Rickettsiales bacterium]|tara:strand:+ start:2829 stop:3095 length:267 start_codon:yes stop_codon:yes gene_type:complete
MSDPKKNSGLDKLISYNRLISFIFSGVILLVYFSFIVILAFFPEILRKPVAGTSITYGIFAGLSIILFSILMTFVYVLIANNFLDKLK